MSIPARLLVAALSVVVCSYAFSKPIDARLEIADDGRCTLQGKPVALSDLRARLLELKAAHPDVQLQVLGSDKASYAQIAPVMQLVEEVGLSRIRFVAHWPDAPASSASGVR